MKICCIIPAYNEESTIGEVIKGVQKYFKNKDIRVVDNLSTDGTLDKVISLGLYPLMQYVKKGYGISQYYGQKDAIEAHYEFILQIDADGQHDPDDIPKLIEKMNNGQYDIVLGSRFLNGIPASLSFTRKAGIIFFSKIISFIAKQKVTDVTSGFKIYKVESLKKLHRPSDINPAVGQMTEIAKKGMKICEVAVEMKSRKYGNSHLSFGKFVVYPLRAIYNIIKVLVFY